ncbi:MAG: class I mannose-6-phosphate isomerase [Verrucomicrobia bacterium]|nr:class I mannose-6-phosphate isomerase [Verrucomicrobiota bacterium]
MERVWGGRQFAELYGRPLPEGPPIGESWELVDRPEAQSVVASGPLRGHRLHELWTRYRQPLFGAYDLPPDTRFPLLFKLLDARETLSLQVHPPAEVAEELGGEPKTEMWYVTQAEPDAQIYAGLRTGATRDDFERSLASGHAAELIHAFASRPGDCIFIPSGRIHAIGGGNVIVEIMQNSDTTYRVFDWNRVGLDGRPRKLHVDESLRSILFDDFEPTPARPQGETLVDCAHFHVERLELQGPRRALRDERFAVLTVVAGSVECAGERFGPGDLFLIPACLPEAELVALDGSATVLRATLP